MSVSAGALDILRRRDHDMAARNLVGVDKFYHCVAMCEALSRGALDASFAAAAGVARRLYQQYGKGELADERTADNRANGQGTAAGLRNQSCSISCSNLMPAGVAYP